MFQRRIHVPAEDSSADHLPQKYLGTYLHDTFTIDATGVSWMARIIWYQRVALLLT